MALNILIVEDNALVAMAYEAIAMDAGYKAVTIANDAASAFKQAQMLNFDVALVDLRLSDGLTGNAIAVGLCKNYDVKSIIIITGDAPHLSLDARDISIAVLLKPISGETLRYALNAAASRTNSH